MSLKGEVLIVVRIAVVRLQKRGHRIDHAPWFKNPIHFLDRRARIREVLQDRLAEYRLGCFIAVREEMGICDNIDIGEGSDVQIHQDGMLTAGASSDGNAESASWLMVKNAGKGFDGSPAAKITEQSGLHFLGDTPESSGVVFFVHPV
jgi:hypothetical protein